MELAADPRVIWHDLECGGYRADLPLWRELAAAHPDGPVLDIGAGSGRITLDLARRGRRMFALDSDPALLAALRRRAPERSDIETMCADARAFVLPGEEWAPLCIVPMQTVQLLGGRDGRTAFLRCARAALTPGGLLACAIVTELEPFDCTGGAPAPWPETTTDGGLHYISQATRVHIHDQRIAIERLRRILPAPPQAPPRPDALPALHPEGEFEYDTIQLDCLSVDELEREAAAIGFHPEPARHIPPTADHAGSEVVMLRV